MPELDELYSVSDLHLGGESGFQIFDQGVRLGAVIRQLAERKKVVALVINGDFVDFLAEPAAIVFDPFGAESKLARIAADPSFLPVFEGLRRFVQADDHHLVVVLGNHDVELALPGPAALLADLLCQKDRPARGRLHFAVDGTGFATMVGRARILLVHGNETDPWNRVEQEPLRRARAALNARTPLPAWTSNAGTRLVIEVMNEVKRAHPVVDLLKPEFQAAIPTVLALEPGLVGKVRRLAPTLVRLTIDRITGRGRLSGEPAAGIEVSQDRAMSMLFASSDRIMPSGDELLQSALADPRDPIAMLGGAGGAETLGAAGMAWAAVRGRSREDSLRDALLRYTSRDESFDPGATDPTAKAEDARVGNDIHFLLAGHTHLERALHRQSGGYYFNTGTWARLIRLERAMIDDGARFSRFYAACETGRLDALDKVEGLILRRPTVAAIWREGLTTVGELQHADGPEGAPTLARVPGTPTFKV